ncbi:MAG: phosphoglycerate dehydrogenase [Magnetospirillum sp.]|nr:phosphoglycerate dehydrogenase [Magnetospirillum sp.]
MSVQKPRIIVTTVPFGAIDDLPIRLIREAGLEMVINPLGRRLQPDEVAGVIGDFHIVIAGTERIDAATLAACPNVKAICRVGIGLDGLDLTEARRRGIQVSYTPDGPSPAVAELAIGLMIDCLRGVSRTDHGLRQGQWNRHTGARLGDSTIGVIGCGRIGSRVIAHLAGGFPGVRILAHDIQGPMTFPGADQVTWVDRETLLRQADVVSLHVPLSADTYGMIGDAELAQMKPSAALINTARGGIVDEAALARALAAGTIASAAIDVFEVEPYAGPLRDLEQAVLTCHMGSMTRDCRLRMEVEATEEAIRFARGEALLSPVPENEYVLASRRK